MVCLLEQSGLVDNFTASRQSRALKQETYKTHRTGSNSTFLPTSWLLWSASVLEGIIQKAKCEDLPLPSPMRAT
jgi:hypothetical protein